MYETCERDIGVLDIHRFLRVDGCQRDPRDRGVTNLGNFMFVLRRNEQ